MTQGVKFVVRTTKGKVWMELGEDSDIITTRRRGPWDALVAVLSCEPGEPLVVVIDNGLGVDQKRELGVVKSVKRTNVKAYASML